MSKPVHEKGIHVRVHAFLPFVSCIFLFDLGSLLGDAKRWNCQGRCWRDKYWGKVRCCQEFSFVRSFVCFHVFLSDGACASLHTSNCRYNVEYANHGTSYLILSNSDQRHFVQARHSPAGSSLMNMINKYILDACFLEKRRAGLGWG